MSPDARERLLERRCSFELDVSLRQRPRREVDVRVRERRQDAAAPKVDPIRGGEGRLVRPDAAGDAIPCDRECRRGRQRRVQRADDAVRDDHARSVNGRSSMARQAGTIARPTQDRSLGFESPLALISLVLLPVAVAAYLFARRRRSRYAVRYTNVDVLRQVAPRVAPRRERLVALLAATALGLLCLAVARPEMTRSAPIENATVVLVIDTSRSMLSPTCRRPASPPRNRPRAGSSSGRPTGFGRPGPLFSRTDTRTEGWSPRTRARRPPSAPASPPTPSRRGVLLEFPTELWRSIRRLYGTCATSSMSWKNRGS